MDIHFLTVLLAAVAAFIIGFLLHGPVGGKLWMKLANVHPTGNEKFSQMIPQMISNLVVNIVMAWVLTVVYGYAATSAYGSAGVGMGLKVAALAWLGFSAATTYIDVIWMGKKKGLWLYDNLSMLLSMLAMGAIIAW